jgi:NRAMP (natural resistance-associated macrophage protein)-like metal ion transporter
MKPVSKAASETSGTKRKRPKNSLTRLLRVLGPGLVTGAADDDPSGIATYSIAGAQHGLGLLWTALVSWPLMGAVQMMCARIGMVTGLGLAGALRKKVPKPLLVIVSFALFAANTINIGADLSGMADATEMLTGIKSYYWVLPFGVVIAVATIRFPYEAIARVLKWLALVLFAYVVTGFIVKPDWGLVAHRVFVPMLPKDHDAWGTLVALLGTTISPYLFFWQSSQEVEEDKSRGKKTLAERRGASDRQIVDRKMDVAAGTLVSNGVMFFIILTTALTLNKSGVTHVETSRQAAEALRPLAGNFAAILFTIGLVGVGFLAIPTLAGSAAYAFAETFGWRQGLDETFPRARAFYVVVVASVALGVTLDLLKVSAMQALYWSAIVNGVLAPFLLVGILLVAHDRELMQGQPSSRLSMVVVTITTILMFGAAIGMFLF